MIYRVETKYGTYDCDTLQQAKRQSKEGDHIQLVVNEFVILSRVKRKYATPAWERRIRDKFGY